MPAPIVREGGLTAMLSYLDFFSTNVQRTATSTAANCCRSLPVDTFEQVLSIAPILRGVLGYSDQRVVENACLGLVRIVDSFRHHPDKLERLLDADLIAAVLALLVPGQATVGPGTYTQVLRMLAHAARASPEVAIALVDQDIAATVYLILVGVGAPTPDGTETAAIRQQHADDDMLVLGNLVHRPKDQVQEALSLVTELLPTLPRDGVFSSKPGKADKKVKVKREEDDDPGAALLAAAPAVPDGNVDVEIKVEEGVSPPAVASASSTRAAANDRRIAHVSGTDRRANVVRFHTLLLPTLVDVYSASVGVQVRTKALLGMAKTIQFCPEDALDQILEVRRSR